MIVGEMVVVEMEHCFDDVDIMVVLSYVLMFNASTWCEH